MGLVGLRVNLSELGLLGLRKRLSPTLYGIQAPAATLEVHYEPWTRVEIEQACAALATAGEGAGNVLVAVHSGTV